MNSDRTWEYKPQGRGFRVIAVVWDLSRIPVQGSGQHHKQHIRRGRVVGFKRSYVCLVSSKVFRKIAGIIYREVFSSRGTQGKKIINALPAVLTLAPYICIKAMSRLVPNSPAERLVMGFNASEGGSSFSARDFVGCDSQTERKNYRYQRVEVSSGDRSPIPHTIIGQRNGWRRIRCRLHAWWSDIPLLTNSDGTFYDSCECARIRESCLADGCKGNRNDR